MAFASYKHGPFMALFEARAFQWLAVCEPATGGFGSADVLFA
jgi:hypothetical protein